MPQNLPPARACVGAGLRENINVLINVVAHKYVSKSQKAISAGGFLNKEVMNVQSISHWAPASVGPYSQCVRVIKNKNFYYICLI